MLTARMFAKRARQLSLLFVVTATIVGFAGSFATQRTLACPEEPPQPLRLLFTQSDRVVVARLGKSEEVKTEEQDESSGKLMKTALEVSQTLKGETVEPVVYVYHWTWEGYDGPFSATADDGKPMLLFLTQRDEGDGYEIDAMNYGVKKLADVDLEVYVKRIEELAAILAQDNPDESRIVEWLVRCAEETATRWEGAIELSQSVDVMRAKDAAPALAPDVTEAAVTGAETIEGEGEAIETGPYSILGTDDTFARLLTTGQKDRLSAVLLADEKIEGDDYLLITIVRTWNEPRLIPFLLSNLRTVAETSPYDAAELMSIITDTLKDDAFAGLVEEYRNTFINGFDEVAHEVPEATSESEQVDDPNVINEARAKAVKDRLDTQLDYFITLAQSVKQS